MGVKTTVCLTRKDAIEKAADLYERSRRRIVEALYYAMSDEQLEVALERMNDAANGGEGLEKYLIRG